MTGLETIALQRHGNVAVIQLSRPEFLNAINAQMRRELKEAVEQAAEDCRAIVLGAQGRLFCSGTDLKEQAVDDGPDTEALLTEEYLPMLDAIRQSPLPVVAAVAGDVVGIGIAPVLNADMVVMADSAHLILAFARIGLIPDGGISWLLHRCLPHQQLFELMVQGGRLSADEMLRKGLCNRVVPASSVLDVAIEVAQGLAELSPEMVRSAKRVLREGASIDYSAAVKLEAQLQTECVASESFHQAHQRFIGG